MMGAMRMARKAKPENEKGRAATARWRARAKAAGNAEIGLVDTAIANAVAVFGLVADEHGSERDQQRFQGIERMAVNFLISRGKSRAHAAKFVLRRLRRLDVRDIVPLVNDHQSG